MNGRVDSLDSVSNPTQHKEMKPSSFHVTNLRHRMCKLKESTDIS